MCPPLHVSGNVCDIYQQCQPGGGLGGGGEVGEHRGVIPSRTPGGQPSHGGRDTAMNLRSGLYGVTAGDKVHSMHYSRQQSHNTDSCFSVERLYVQLLAVLPHQSLGTRLTQYDRVSPNMVRCVGREKCRMLQLSSQRQLQRVVRPSIAVALITLFQPHEINLRVGEHFHFSKTLCYRLGDIMLKINTIMM